MAKGDVTFSQDYNEACTVEQVDGTKQRALHVVSDTLPYLNVGQDFFLKVNQGLVPGHSVVDKFGVNKALTPSTDPEDLWEFGGLYNYDADGTAPIVSIVSDSASDTEPIEIQGLDIDGNLVTQTITLNGTTSVALTTALWRCFRMGNVGSNYLLGTVYVYAGTSPVPANADVRAIIDAEHGQTLMALYTIPKGKVAFLYRGELGVGLEGNSASLAEYAHCHYESRRFGKTFRVKKAITCMVGGNAVYQDKRSFPDIVPSLTDIKLKIIEVTQNMGMWGTFDLLLIDEDLFPTEYLVAIGQPGY